MKIELPEWGATAHYIDEKIDTGSIIRVYKFNFDYRKLIHPSFGPSINGFRIFLQYRYEMTRSISPGLLLTYSSASSIETTGMSSCFAFNIVGELGNCESVHTSATSPYLARRLLIIDKYYDKTYNFKCCI